MSVFAWLWVGARVACTDVCNIHGRCGVRMGGVGMWTDRERERVQIEVTYTQ